MILLTMIIKLPHLKKIFLFGLIPLLITFLFGFVFADELDQVTADLAKQQKQLASLEAQKNQLASDINSTSVSLSQISARLTDAEAQLSAIEKSLKVKEDTLKEFEEDRNSLIRELYKQGKFSSLEVFLGSDDLDTSTKNLFYYDENLDLLKDRITALNAEVEIFKANKAAAKKLRDELASLRSQYASRLASSQNQYAYTSSQLAATKSSIKNLSAKQSQLILEKFAASGGTETVGENPAASEPLPAPGFSPSYFMATYGFPHRIGMSQYGARGRAMKGQSYQTILNAYYGHTATTATNIPTTIKVNGCNEYGQCWNNYTYNFEDYLKHLYEMPSSWQSAALQAQAVAARTYALRYALQGKAICPSQSCQVIKKEINAASWQNAVNATKGKTVGGNNPLPTFYHSTAGGYTISKLTWISYWSYNDGIKDFYNSTTAYEQIAGSPWYHTGWGHRTGISGQYNPWLTTEEFADIFNAFLLCKTGSQPYQLKSDCEYTQYLSPIDKGGWSMSKVRSELQGNGITPVTSITAVVTTYIGGSVPANTASIYVSGSHGTYSFSGRYFRDMFNLRSRGTLAIKTYRFDVGYCSSSSCTSPTFK